MPRVLRNKPCGPLLECWGIPAGGKGAGSRYCAHVAGMATEEQK